jgi:2-(1,2-epoxy-1,2-dihydrophenyl)acetyl-CoA isomerase
VSDAEAEVLCSRREGRVLTLMLNRPARLNALDGELHERLHAALADAAGDDSIGAVVLTGAGRAFCSGGDMGSSRERTAPPPTAEQRADALLRHADSARLLHSMPKPTIAMINGAAAGAGLALALACDLRTMAEDATLSTSYARVAMSGDLGISFFLPRLVGAARARELLFLSPKIDARRALEIGLVNRVESTSALADVTAALAAELAGGPAVALRFIKSNLNAAETVPLEEVLRQEAFAMARCSRTQDVKEAALAFREKRSPVFKGQ